MPPKGDSTSKSTPLETALKKVRDILGADKSKGAQLRVEKWGEGEKKLEVLLNDPDFSFKAFDDYNRWAEKELQELISPSSISAFLAFFRILLEHLYNQKLKPTLKIIKDLANSNEKDTEKENSDLGILARVERIIALSVHSVQQAFADDIIGSHAKELHTKQWIQLLDSILEVCMSGKIEDSRLQSDVCEIFHHIAADSDSAKEKLYLKDEEVIGFEKLGSYLYQSKVSSTSIWILRTLVHLLPPMTAAGNGKRSDALKKVIGTQSWSSEVRADIFRKIGKIVEDYHPDQLMANINALATDESHVRPTAYQVSSLLVDNEDQLDSEKSKRYMEKGELVVYLDTWSLTCMAYDEDGAEMDISFRLEKITNIVRKGSSEFLFSFHRTDGGQSEGKLVIKPEQADDFFKYIQPHLNLTEINTDLSDVPLNNDSAALDLDPAVLQAEIYRMAAEEKAQNALSDKIPKDQASQKNDQANPTHQDDASPKASTEDAKSKTSQTKSNHRPRQSLPVASTVQNQSKEGKAGQSRPAPKLREKPADTPIRPKRKSAAAAATNVKEQLAGEISIDEDQTLESNNAENPKVVVEEEYKDDVNLSTSTKDDNDEEKALPPASQQLATKVDNATTRSAKKFGKTVASRASGRPRIAMDNDSELSEIDDEISRSNKESAKPPLLKAVLAKNTTTKKTFKPPAPKRSGISTLHSQIEKGSKTATPIAIQTSKSKGRLKKSISINNEEHNGEKVPPEPAREQGSSKHVAKPSESTAVPPTPQKAANKRKSQPIQEQILEEDIEEEELEKHSPLPWVLEADGGKGKPKSNNNSETTTSISPYYPNGAMGLTPTWQPSSTSPPSPTGRLITPILDPPSTSPFPVGGHAPTPRYTSPGIPVQVEPIEKDQDKGNNDNQEDVFRLPAQNTDPVNHLPNTTAQDPEPCVPAPRVTRNSSRSHPQATSTANAATQVGSSLIENSNLLQADPKAHHRTRSNDNASTLPPNGNKPSPLANHESNAEHSEDGQAIVNRTVASMSKNGNSAKTSRVNTTTSKSKNGNMTASIQTRINRDKIPSQAAEEDHTESITSTPRPTVTRASVKAMFDQIDNDREEEEEVEKVEERKSKKARIALLPSSSMIEEDIQPSKSKSSGKSGKDGSTEVEKDKGKKRKSEESENSRGKNSRRRSSSADAKAISESERLEQKAVNEIEETLSQIASLINTRTQNKLKFPTKQARVAKNQFGKLAKNLIDDFHKESKTNIKLPNSKSSAANTKYENLKTTIKTLSEEYKKLDTRMVEFMNIDRKNWEFNKALID